MKCLVKVLMLVAMLIAVPFAGSASAMVSYDYVINFDDGIPRADVSDFYKAQTGVEFSGDWMFAGRSNGYALGIPESIDGIVVDPVITFNKVATEVSFGFTGDIEGLRVRDNKGASFLWSIPFTSGRDFQAYTLPTLQFMGLANVLTIEFCDAYFANVDDLSFNAAPTPIPGTLWMLISGMLGLVGVRRFA